MLDLIRDIFGLMIKTKKFWLIPVIFIMILLGGLLIVAQSSAVAPFIYTLF